MILAVEVLRVGATHAARGLTLAVMCLLSVAIGARAEESGKETSTALVRSKTTDSYQLTKQLLGSQPYFAKSSRSDILPPPIDPSDEIEPYDLATCGSWMYLLGETNQQDDVTSALLTLSFDVLELETDLRVLGFPSDLWAKPIADFEKHELRRIEANVGDLAADQGDSPALESLRRDLLKRLTRYHKAHPLDVPEVVLGLGCGDDGIYVKITTAPSGGRVFVIPQFYFDLCKAQRIDPESREVCDRWVEVQPDLDFNVSGIYRYYVSWSDGTSKSGQFQSDGFSLDSQSLVIAMSIDSIR